MRDSNLQHLCVWHHSTLWLREWCISKIFGHYRSDSSPAWLVKGGQLIQQGVYLALGLLELLLSLCLQGRRGKREKRTNEKKYFYNIYCTSITTLILLPFACSAVQWCWWPCPRLTVTCLLNLWGNCTAPSFLLALPGGSPSPPGSDFLLALPGAPPQSG